MSPRGLVRRWSGELNGAIASWSSDRTLVGIVRITAAGPEILLNAFTRKRILSPKEIAKSITYTFNQKVIQFLVADMHKSDIPDDSTNYGNLFVLFNGECVLHNDVMFHDKGYKHYGVYFSTASLKSLKAAIWIDDLRYLVNALTDFEMRARDKQRADAMSRIASNIDLSKKRHGKFPAPPDRR